MSDCPPDPVVPLTSVRIARPEEVRGTALLTQEVGRASSLKDGSIKAPIKLPKLQAYNQAAIPALVGVLPDGTLVAWKAGNFAGVKKLALEDSSFKIIEDYTSDLLSQACAEEQCSAIDGFLGYKTLTYSCPGEPTTIKYQIVRGPKDCSEDSIGGGSDSDVWEPQYPYHNEGVPVATGRWLGTLPRSFAPTHIRLSCGYNNGVTLDWEIETQAGVMVAHGTWEYEAEVYTKLIPYSSWNTSLLSQLLSGGLQLNLNTDPTGAYATVMSGLSIAILGKWV